MSVLSFLRPSVIGNVPEDRYVAIHPLDDVAEEKMDISTLGPMPMTTGVRLSLMALRGYLILMMLLVLYHVLDLAGIAAWHGRW
jgi:hypothetical protein